MRSLASHSHTAHALTTALVALCLTVGCSTTKPTPDNTLTTASNASSGNSTPDDTSPKPAPNPFKGQRGAVQLPDETVTHSPSGVRFPVKLGTFSRSLAYSYQATGTNFSVRYETSAPQPRVRVSVYVYLGDEPTPTDKATLVQKVHGVVGAIKQFNQQATVTNAKTFTEKWGGEEATFAGVELHSPGMLDWAYLTRQDRWWIKLRITGEAARADEVRKLQADLVRALSAEATARVDDYTRMTRGMEDSAP